MTKTMKSLRKSGFAPLIENQYARPCGRRATPRGGLPRDKGMPLTQRPVSYSGDPCRK